MRPVFFYLDASSNLDERAREPFMDLVLNVCVREPIMDPVLVVCVRGPIMDPVLDACV